MTISLVGIPTRRRIRRIGERCIHDDRDCKLPEGLCNTGLSVLSNANTGIDNGIQKQSYIRQGDATTRAFEILKTLSLNPDAVVVTSGTE